MIISRFSQNCEKRLLVSSRPSAWNNSAPTGRIFIKFGICTFFENQSTKIKVSLKSDKNNGTVHDDVRKFMLTSRRILLRIRNISDESCTENQNTFYVDQPRGLVVRASDY
jgi:hypothetical protein